MKKLLAVLLAITACFALFACKKGPEPQPQTQAMTYAEYDAAALESKVIIEAYVQATQSWWDGKITVYAQDEDGAYFIYNMACAEQDAAKLVPGAKIKVEGYKAEWSGEVEIIDAIFTLLEGSYIAPATDVTALLGTDDLIKHQNKYVSFKGMTVASAAKYKWDGSGVEGDDLYFDVSLNGNTYTFTVESYLCDKNTDVYKAVQQLKVGDVIDMNGFLYWYEGVNPHITAVDVVTMGYASYDAAALESKVVIDAYVQATQSWWDGKITVYAQDEDGAYFIYNMACAEQDAAKLVPGAKIKVEGYKAEWAGEIEIIDATFTLLEGSYIAPATDVTALLGTDDLIKHQNKYVSFKGMTVASAAKYKWDGSGVEGDDLYFDVSLNGNTYTFTVESYLCDKNTDVYKAVQQLKVGDVIDMNGFLYWYEGVNPHITSVSAASVAE